MQKTTISYTFLIIVLVVAALNLPNDVSSSSTTKRSNCSNSITGFSKSDFPPSFIFGASSSASQVEGAEFEDGRTPSIRDTYIFAHPSPAYKVRACDQYHKYKEDVKLMVDTGLDAYRLSISWSRLIPNGRGTINPKAVEYYNNLINELVTHGIQPHVTLLHQDTPQALDDDYEGWVNPQIVKDFTTYADVCFREFGDRVLYWTTINEPNVEILPGYDFGISPPQRCSEPFGTCTRGNSSTEPYIVAHNYLLAHASVFRLYKQKYQRKQQGYVGLNLFAAKFVPETNSNEDILATERARDFLLGWFMDPLMKGDYPNAMKKSAKNRIPSFTKGESELVKNSFDFIGVNCYTSFRIKDNPQSFLTQPRDAAADCGATTTMANPNDDPTVFQYVLEYFKQDYGNPPIYIHENGYRMLHNSSLDDPARIKYLNTSIGSVLDAVRNGSNARGYFVWSLMDTPQLMGGWEWSSGLYYVDINVSDLKRYPKLSAFWYSAFLMGPNISFGGDNDDGNILYFNNSTSVFTRPISAH